MRRAARKDGNQDQIVADLRRSHIGVSVAVTHQLGAGFPDIVIGFRGVNYLIEIKDGSKPPSAQKLTPAEKEFHTGWQGQIDVANDLDEVLRIIGAI